MRCFELLQSFGSPAKAYNYIYTHQNYAVMKVTSYLSVLLVLLLLSCARNTYPEGYWRASNDQYSTAEKQYVLVIADEKWTHLSEDISLFANLERLTVQNTALVEAPEYINQLTKLERLNLSRNKLKSLPKTIIELQQIKHLDLSNNNFEVLPEEILALKNLEVLDLRNNNLSDLPQALDQLKHLDTVYIGGNNFTEEQRRMFRKWLPYTKIISRSSKH
jgi:hypothetical protein